MAHRIFIVAVALLAVAATSANAMEVERLARATRAPHRISLQSPKATSTAKPILGATAVVSEKESGLVFVARVDTGAKSCSIHASHVSVRGGSERMEENVGKTVQFRVANRDGKSVWLERRIAEVVLVRTSEGAEWRYKVPMTLRCDGKEKRVVVSLNDRSEMSCALLVGRNFLAGDFLVDAGIGQ